ncbi:MAG: carbohydrate binding domain-containing protein [Sedimentisphaerales bacterium]
MDNEDIARYREQLTRNSDLKSEFARLQKWGDQRIQQPLGVPKHETNSEGQWIYPEYKAGYKNAAGKYQWEWKFNTKLQRLANDVYDLGVLCAFTGSEKYADYAKNILLALVDVYGYEKGNPPVDPQWKNHFEPFGFDGGDTALFLVKTCNGYDQIYNLARFTAEERRQVEDNLIRPLAYHLKSQNYMFTSLQNWGMMCLYGVFAAGMTLEDSTLTNAALYGLNGTQEKPTGGIFGYWFNPAAVDQDKNWDKSDTKSQLFSLSIMASVAEICWHHGIDLYSYHDATMKKIFDYPLAFSSTEASTSESLEIKYREFSRLQGVTAYDYAFLRYRDPLYLPVIERMDKTLGMGGNCEIPCLFSAGASMTGRPSPEPIASRVAATLPHNDITAAVRSTAEMLVNGSFADGNAHWVVEESGATGRAEYVKEGPDGSAALRLRVLTIGDHAWRLQVYQTGMRVEKDRTYVMTFWSKSDRDCNVTVNCMQNHEPWDHHTQEKMPVSTEWKQMHFTFVAPWDDNNVRISFTDLATAPDQVYWFAGCSLVPAP